jgi:crotonobetainyl-CoA:carnitine CoA-transferase CaiB-like acyl-CoA transferase
MNRRPLEGIRVLDLTNYFAGPFCTMYLAGLGAEIIQVELPDTGNPLRTNPPMAGPRGMSMEKQTPEDLSVVMLKRGRNKKSITLNLRHPEGRRIFLDLAAKADVVIENFRYGYMNRLDLSYEDIRKSNPGIIYCCITGFGHDGPQKERRAFDLIAQAMSGFMDVTGEQDGPPLSAGIAVGDAIPSLNAVIGIISALYHKKVTGEGQKVDISMQDCLFAMVYDEAFDVLKQLGLPVRTGNRSQRIAPFSAYEAKDGWFALGVITDEQFHILLKAIGREDLIGDPRYDNKTKRFERVNEVDGIISDWARTIGKNEAVEILLENRVPAGPVMDIEELLNDPHLHARNMIQDLVHPRLGIMEGAKAPGYPIKFSACPRNYEQPAPMLGDDNKEIYTNLLGLDEETLDRLRREKII